MFQCEPPVAIGLLRCANSNRKRERTERRIHSLKGLAGESVGGGEPREYIHRAGRENVRPSRCLHICIACCARSVLVVMLHLAGECVGQPCTATLNCPIKARRLILLLSRLWMRLATRLSRQCQWHIIHCTAAPVCKRPSPTVSWSL